MTCNCYVHLCSLRGMCMQKSESPVSDFSLTYEHVVLKMDEYLWGIQYINHSLIYPKKKICCKANNLHMLNETKNKQLNIPNNLEAEGRIGDLL